MMDISVVMPMHDEQAFLPYSLRGVSTFHGEVVVVNDRCTDGSEVVVSRYAPNARVVPKTRRTWKNGCAEAKAYGVTHTSGRLVLHVDADVVFDWHALPTAIQLAESCDCVVFGYRQYSLFGSWRSRVKDAVVNLLNTVTWKLGVQPKTGGLYLVHRRFATLHDHDSEYAGPQQRGRTVFQPTRSIHLRPRYDRASQFQRGAARASMPQYNVLKVVVMGVLMVEPWLVAGFLRRRLSRGT